MFGDLCPRLIGNRSNLLDGWAVSVGVPLWPVGFVGRAVQDWGWVGNEFS
jgi:hypothetical protein